MALSAVHLSVSTRTIIFAATFCWNARGQVLTGQDNDHVDIGAESARA
jgi:hypothetical protein